MPKGAHNNPLHPHKVSDFFEFIMRSNQWQNPPTMMDILRMKEEEIAILRRQLEQCMAREEQEYKRFATIVVTPPKSYFNFQPFDDEVLDVPIKKSVSLVEHEESSYEEEALIEDATQVEITTTINAISTPGTQSCPTPVEPKPSAPWLDKVKGIHNTPQVLCSINQSCKGLREDVMSEFLVPFEKPWPHEREMLQHEHLDSFFLPILVDEALKYDHHSPWPSFEQPPPSLPLLLSRHLPPPKSSKFKHKYNLLKNPQHSKPRFVKWIDGHRTNVRFKIGNVVWASSKEENFSCLMDVLIPSLRTSFSPRKGG